MQDPLLRRRAGSLFAQDRVAPIAAYGDLSRAAVGKILLIEPIDLRQAAGFSPARRQ
jgi:hypothetical protein